MYRVAGNMMDSYMNDDAAPQRKSNLDMPQVTLNNRRMTNIQLKNGDTVQGIRRNKDLGLEDMEPKAYEPPQPTRALRYTPGLKCDAALEALRPERDMKHQPLQGGEQWRKKLIQHPQTYEGSFADADMQKFRPNPMPSPMEDPWFCSRLPDQQFMEPNMMAQQPAMDMGYNSVYPQDELSRIKMRNRRFAQSCAMEGMQGMQAPQQQYFQQPPQQMWRGPYQQAPPPMAYPPQMTEEMMMSSLSDELSNIETDLNMTRRATRPFVPTSDPAYFDLQRQVNLLETTPYTPVKAPRFNAEEVLTSDDLPKPKARIPKKEAEPAPSRPVRQEVGIKDQIAIRSLILGKGLGSSSE